MTSVYKDIMVKKCPQIICMLFD